MISPAMPSRAKPLAHCDLHGLTCDEHPTMSWPHDDCLGAGVDCLRIECEVGRDNLRITLLNLLLYRAEYPPSAQGRIDQQIAEIETKLRIWEQAQT